MPLLPFLIVFVFCCTSCYQNEEVASLDDLAITYVKLGLTLGQYDSDFVDAYYGPDSLRPITSQRKNIPKDSLIAAIDSLKVLVDRAELLQNSDTLRARARWMSEQLTAFNRRIRIFTGELSTFDEESLLLFGVQAPTFNERHYLTLLERFDKSLPENGPIQERYLALSQKFTIPADKVDTVFKVAIAEARKRTKARFQLPLEETFTLEYVTGKPWAAYNWYKGNYTSLIQVNIDLPINITGAINVACHEGYPGHHVYNAMLEKSLYRDKGWFEISLYPLFSPQSFIAEGSANFGIEMAFPGYEYNKFIKEVLLPIAGLDTTNIDTYLRAFMLKKQLSFATNEIARGILNKTMSNEEILRWSLDYGLMPKQTVDRRIEFIQKYRSYVICYNYGEQLVSKYIEEESQMEKNDDGRWQVLGQLLSSPITPRDLVKK